MNELFELTIVRKKLVIKSLKEITTDDLVPVRETLNSIDFILGNEDKWEYTKIKNGWQAITKIRLSCSKEILKFVEDNKDKLRIDSIDRVFLTDLTKVFRITRIGKSKQEINELDLNSIILGNKNRIIKKINETVSNINDLAKTMGDIL